MQNFEFPRGGMEILWFVCFVLKLSGCWGSVYCFEKTRSGARAYLLGPYTFRTPDVSREYWNNIGIMEKTMEPTIS